MENSTTPAARPNFHAIFMSYPKAAQSALQQAAKDIAYAISEMNTEGLRTGFCTCHPDGIDRSVEKKGIGYNAKVNIHWRAEEDRSVNHFEVKITQATTEMVEIWEGERKMVLERVEGVLDWLIV